MKKLIILLLVLVGSVMADEVWLNDGTVVKNCKIIGADEKQVKVKLDLGMLGMFNKRDRKTYERDTVIKTIYKEIDPIQPSEFSDEVTEQRLNEKKSSTDKRIDSLEASLGILMGVLALIVYFLVSH